MALDLSDKLGSFTEGAVVGTMARGIIGSEILRIAADIRALEASGTKTCNLTVGDFKTSEFPLPPVLSRGIASALEAGETNYPPSDGVLALRQSVRRLYQRKLGLAYPIESIVIAGGARPIIYGVYRSVIDAGETVVYPVPSWNNNHYVHLVGARGVPVKTSADRGFMPTAEELAPHLADARLVALCSPLNPTGTMMPAAQLEAIAKGIVEENRRRSARGANPIILLYDQIYWELALREKHATPVELVPEIAAYTVFVDGVSKEFAATGIRVGWGVGPPAIIARMRDVLGHVGAWAPKAEQVACAKFLDDDAATRAALVEMRRRVDERLSALYDGLTALGARGLPVRAISPQGAIYLTVQFDLVGKGGITTNDQIRALLLDKAAFAVVPFQAFGYPDESGWFRLSVGATNVREIQEALPRVEAAMRSVLYQSFRK